MPYTLVTPQFPPICRPVLLLPTIFGLVLHKRLAEQEGYQLCEPGKKNHFIFKQEERKREKKLYHRENFPITVRNSGLSHSIKQVSVSHVRRYVGLN